jgi:hypothetical protein
MLLRSSLVVETLTCISSTWEQTGYWFPSQNRQELTGSRRLEGDFPFCALSSSPSLPPWPDFQQLSSQTKGISEIQARYTRPRCYRNTSVHVLSASHNCSVFHMWTAASATPHLLSLVKTPMVSASFQLVLAHTIASHYSEQLLFREWLDSSRRPRANSGVNATLTKPTGTVTGSDLPTQQ